MRTKAILFSLAFGAVAFAQQPVVTPGGVVNGAIFTSPVAGGALISIFGTNLATKVAQADTVPLSTSLGGVTVTFTNGTTSIPAPMVYVQPDDPTNKISSQINAQIPWDLVPQNTSATVTVVVQHDGLTSPPAQVQVAPFSPGIYSSGGRAIAVNNSDGTLTWPAGAVPGLASHGAKVGDFILIYATGLGAVSTPVANGSASLDTTRTTLVKPIVTVNGIQANVIFSGLAPQFVGVNQVNLQIPQVTPGDNLPIQIQIGGITTPANTTISVIP